MLDSSISMLLYGRLQCFSCVFLADNHKDITTNAVLSKEMLLLVAATYPVVYLHVFTSAVIRCLFSVCKGTTASFCPQFLVFYSLLLRFVVSLILTVVVRSYLFLYSTICQLCRQRSRSSGA